MFGISLEYLWCIFSITVAYLWCIFGISLAYLCTYHLHAYPLRLGSLNLSPLLVYNSFISIGGLKPQVGPTVSKDV